MSPLVQREFGNGSEQQAALAHLLHDEELFCQLSPVSRSPLATEQPS